MITPDRVELEFAAELNTLSKGKQLRDGLSVAAQIGTTLWVGNDESLSLERLTLLPGSQPGEHRYGQHRQFPLADYLRLPVAPPDDPADIEEADLEGLACADGYLWLVGSHSIKRKQPQLEDGVEKARKQLAKLRRDGNRFLLARIPLIEHDGNFTLAQEHTHAGRTRTAAQLHGNAETDDLLDALRDDKHLSPFLSIPGKDNGFDIEGLAVNDTRLFLGLRGPVLRGWAVILELELEEDHKQSTTLRLKAIGPDAQPYRKHFLQLGGLGIRDLCVQGDDLLILAGPTLDLDGPVRVVRWPGGAAPADACMVPAAALERVLELPYGQGEDHAEGMTLFAPEGGAASALLVVYDGASERRKPREHSVIADIFPLA